MILILLPAYNEEESLPSLMPKLKRTMASMGEACRIIVCNDGSRDRTSEMLDALALELPLEVIHHKVNRGLGETSRDLFERAAEVSSSGDIIIRLDCDDTHEPEFIPSLVEHIRRGFDVVIASRFIPGGGQRGIGPYRAFISHCANIIMRVLFPTSGLREYSCGFRAYRAEVIKAAIAVYGNDFIQLKGLGFTCTLEKLVKLKLLGVRFGEVPFVLRYDQKRSSSKMLSSITTFGYLVMTILYYWPWAGWRAAAGEKRRNQAQL